MNWSSRPHVSAIIVNYKTSDYAINCIRSLLRQQDVSVQIIVVDNASGDGSAEKLLRAYPTEIQLIQSESNSGFAKANNVAAKIAEGDYFLVINPDLELLGTHDLANLVSELTKTKNAGVIGPRILEPRRDREVKPKSSYSQQRYLKATPGIHQLPGEIAWILGACMLFPACIYQQIGGFDEDFFLYGEDADICLRVRKASYVVAYTDKVTVEHWGGASETTAISYDKWRRKKKGYYQFCLKHYDETDVRRIIQKGLFRNRIKLWGLKGRQYLRWGSPISLQTRIERVQAEHDVLCELLTDLSVSKQKPTVL